MIKQINRSLQDKHRFEVKSSFEELEDFYKAVKKVTSCFPDNDNLITCLHEILVNAIEHGNMFNPDKMVVIELTVDDKYVIAEVEDQGEGFNWLEKIDRPMDFEGFSDRGRGIALTRILSGELRYNPKGNRVTLLVEAEQKTGGKKDAG